MIKSDIHGGFQTERESLTLCVLYRESLTNQSILFLKISYFLHYFLHVPPISIVCLIHLLVNLCCFIGVFVHLVMLIYTREHWFGKIIRIWYRLQLWMKWLCKDLSAEPECTFLAFGEMVVASRYKSEWYEFKEAPLSSCVSSFLSLNSEQMQVRWLLHRDTNQNDMNLRKNHVFHVFPPFFRCILNKCRSSLFHCPPCLHLKPSLGHVMLQISNS